MAHPERDGADEARNVLYHWIVKGWESVGEGQHPIDSLQLVWEAVLQIMPLEAMMRSTWHSKM
jgi:hypothetical protein